ncbi:MAG TPA: Uma2 family endonuclease [Pirellulales bacterium]|nr:Uma2 family endonuclease [Pirellulales bacterium]
MSVVQKHEAATVTPLVAGQRLDRATFHDRYEQMPPGTRAELVGGVVYMPSPLRFDHGDRDHWVSVWLDRYMEFTQGIAVSHNASTFLDDEGEPQPDVLLRILPEWGGRIRHVDGYLEGPPDLVIEIARSSRKFDLGPKYLDYERAGVSEYVVVGLEPDEAYWHVRRDERFVRVSPDTDGLFRSVVFPGLWLDAQALFDENRGRLREIVDRGVATPEHAAFVARMAEARKGHSEGGTSP